MSSDKEWEAIRLRLDAEHGINLVSINRCNSIERLDQWEILISSAMFEFEDIYRADGCSRFKTLDLKIEAYKLSSLHVKVKEKIKAINKFKQTAALKKEAVAAKVALAKAKEPTKEDKFLDVIMLQQKRFEREASKRLYSAEARVRKNDERWAMGDAVDNGTAQDISEQYLAQSDLSDPSTYSPLLPDIERRSDEENERERIKWVQQRGLEIAKEKMAKGAGFDILPDALRQAESELRNKEQKFDTGWFIGDRPNYTEEEFQQPLTVAIDPFAALDAVLADRPESYGPRPVLDIKVEAPIEAEIEAKPAQDEVEIKEAPPMKIDRRRRVEPVYTMSEADARAALIAEDAASRGISVEELMRSIDQSQQEEEEII